MSTRNGSLFDALRSNGAETVAWDALPDALRQVGLRLDDPRLKAGIAPPDYLAEITINALEDGP